uniref:Uncharacterized protein n=1 Tax=Panstrongylus lignarius TaxID=156445 RepID=A0A224XS91_9HEMI
MSSLVLWEVQILFSTVSFICLGIFVTSELIGLAGFMIVHGGTARIFCKYSCNFLGNILRKRSLYTVSSNRLRNAVCLAKRCVLP